MSKTVNNYSQLLQFHSKGRNIKSAKTLKVSFRVIGDSSTIKLSTIHPDVVQSEAVRSLQDQGGYLFSFEAHLLNCISADIHSQWIWLPLTLAWIHLTACLFPSSCVRRFSSRLPGMFWQSEAEGKLSNIRHLASLEEVENPLWTS